MYNIEYGSRNIHYNTLSDICDALEELIPQIEVTGVFRLIEHTETPIDVITGGHRTGSVELSSGRKSRKRNFTIHRNVRSGGNGVTAFQTMLPHTKTHHVFRFDLPGVCITLYPGFQFLINVSIPEINRLIQTIYWTTETKDVAIDPDQSWVAAISTHYAYIKSIDKPKPITLFDSTEYLSALFSEKEVSVLVKKITA